ncbi:hypothetical protein Syun_000967 [Stephania yunnanensis]|uniref:Methyltransferase n=1 Tax=Stephania yunnanensis TaxID=152371 RepID=A0AAP0LEM3_9MAGN
MPLTFFSLLSPPPSYPLFFSALALCSIVTPPSARHHALLVPLNVCPSLYSIIALSAVAIAVGVESQPPSPSLIDSNASCILLLCFATAAATMRTSVRAFSSSLPVEQSMEEADPDPQHRAPNTPLSFLKAHPTPPFIPSKLIVNFVLPYQFKITSKDKWYASVPHTKLAEVKGHQNWMKVKWEFLTFPDGGTQLILGALNYIDFI